MAAQSELILLKNPGNASTSSARTEKSPWNSITLPFVLRLSKDERTVFQQNLNSCLTPPWDQPPMGFSSMVIFKIDGRRNHD
jgi:hypothetical protein